MAINNVISVQHNGGFLPDIIMLTQCYYYIREMDKVGIPTPFSDKSGRGKMQTSSPPVITPNRS